MLSVGFCDPAIEAAAESMSVHLHSKPKKVDYARGHQESQNPTTLKDSKVNKVSPLRGYKSGGAHEPFANKLALSFFFRKSD
jgi:hypothetical protein